MEIGEFYFVSVDFEYVLQSFIKASELVWFK